MYSLEILNPKHRRNSILSYIYLSSAIIAAQEEVKKGSAVGCVVWDKNDEDVFCYGNAVLVKLIKESRLQSQKGINNASHQTTGALSRSSN